MYVWKDTTGFSQGDRERKSTKWTLTLVAGFKITVTCGHLYFPGEWVMHCAPWFDTFPLKARVETAEDAQNTALALVRQKVRELADALSISTETAG